MPRTLREYETTLRNTCFESLADSRAARAVRRPVGTPGRSTCPAPPLPNPSSAPEPLEDALKLMKKGVSQKEAAKQAGVSAETLRRFQKANTTSHRNGRRWTISDARPVPVWMATRRNMRPVTVSHDAASDISRHWIAINLFLETNDASHLAAFVGKGLRDSKGVFHPFETHPNVLRKLDSVGELSFVDIYRQTAQQ
jgi:hypothetical protein